MDITPSYSAVRYNEETVVVFTREVGAHEVARALFRLEGPGVVSEKVWIENMIFYAFVVETSCSPEEVVNNLKADLGRFYPE